MSQVTFYLEGIPASVEDPFTLSAGKKKITTLTEAQKEGDQKVYNETVELEKTDEGEFLTVHIGMETKGVDFPQKINLTLGGKHIRVKFLDGKFKIETSKNGFSSDGTELTNNKDEGNGPKVERVYFKIVKAKPFSLYLGKKFIYKLKKEVSGSKEVDLNVKLAEPQQFINLRLVDINDENKEIQSEKVDVGGQGEYIKISQGSGSTSILQGKKDGEYNEPEKTKSDMVETKIYFLGVDFDKENKLAVYLDGKRIHTLSVKEDPIAGVKVDLASDALKRKFTVKGAKQNLNEAREFDVGQGAHILLTVDGDNNVSWKQQAELFKFGYKKNEDGTQSIVVLDE